MYVRTISWIAFPGFQVIPILDLIGIGKNIEPPLVLPDHAILEWSWTLDTPITAAHVESSQTSTCPTHRKYDVSQIGNGFMSDRDILLQLNLKIQDLEQNETTKSELN